MVTNSLYIKTDHAETLSSIFKKVENFILKTRGMTVRCRLILTVHGDAAVTEGIKHTLRALIEQLVENENKARQFYKLEININYG